MRGVEGKPSSPQRSPSEKLFPPPNLSLWYLIPVVQARYSQGVVVQGGTVVKQVDIEDARKARISAVQKSFGEFAHVSEI